MEPLPEVEADEVENRTQRCYTAVKQMITGKSPNECQEIYQKYIALNPQQHTEELITGLIMAIMTEQEGRSAFYKDIVTFSKDNLALFSNVLNMIIVERIHRLPNHSIKQIFWMTNQLIDGGVPSAENTCSNLIRQTAKGDLSPRNLFMVENLLDLLTENRAWLMNSTSFLGPTVIYNITRLIIDHLSAAHNVIRQKEIDFVIGLIREKFEFVLSIGKDFLRLLNSLQRVDGFHQLYHDMYVNEPKDLHPSYEGVKQLFASRTPRRLFQSCLTFDMERKISYLATQVKFGHQKRHQDIFQKQYLTGQESSWLRSDLIRYICTIIHPSNEVLCSDIIPRWAIIGWLLTTLNHVVIQSGPALFFDWFAFDPKSDNIMNIEPAILVMYYSLRSHPQVTALLLDYLSRAPNNFHWKLQDTVRTSIKKSLQQVLEKRVLPSLTPLFMYTKYDTGLKGRLKENFPEYCQADNGVQQHTNGPSTGTPQSAQIATNNVTPTTSPATPTAATETGNPQTAGANKQQGDVIVIDESSTANESSNQQAPSTQQDASKTNQDNSNNSSAPSIGFQPSMKIHMPTSYSTNKSATPPSAKNSSDPKTQGNLIKNGTDPTEALMGTAPATAVPTTAPTKASPSTLPTSVSPRKSSISSVIKQETPTEETPAALGSKRTSDQAPLANHTNQVSSYSSDAFDASNENSSDLQLDSIDNSKLPRLDSSEHDSHIKVIYPFMTVKKVLPDGVIDTFGEEINDHLSFLHRNMSPNDRVTHTHRLLDLLATDQSTKPDMIDNLGCHLATLICGDFEERIHPISQDNASNERILQISPLFVLSHHFVNVEQPKPVSKLLLASVAKYFDSTSFLLLYYMRLCQINSSVHLANFGIPKAYLAFSEACKREDPTKSIVDDMRMMLTYDSEMFCFMLPLIFADFSHSEPYAVMNNCELIRMVTANIDPVTLQDFMCLCLTGSSKIISREDPMVAIEASLNWESWEQFFFWKILTAQSVPIENYIAILTRLNVRKHPEAMASIMSNLQKLSEPDVTILQAVIDSYSKQNEHFVAAIIRYWSIRSDLKEMTKNICMLSFESLAPSPQMKRKGQTKPGLGKSGSSSSTSSSPSATMSTRGEKVLMILDSIRRRAPRNKLLALTELLDHLSQLEHVCNDSLRPRLNLLLQARQRPTKKKKLDKD